MFDFSILKPSSKGLKSLVAYFLVIIIAFGQPVSLVLAETAGTESQTPIENPPAIESSAEVQNENPPPTEASPEPIDQNPPPESAENLQPNQSEAASISDPNQSNLPDTFPFLSPLASKTSKPELDTSSGALHYAYPFTFAPGKNGLTPSLSLRYNSQQTEESPRYGHGWKLDIPSIERVNIRGTDKLYTSKDFVSSLSGELTEIAPNVFGAKTERGDFLTYQFQNNSFIARTKEGITYSYGLSADARQDDPNDASKIYLWMLEKVSDPMGNEIVYTYFKHTQQLYPSSISYGGTAQTPHPFQVSFTWTANGNGSEFFPSYKTGFYVNNYYRLTKITTNRNYHLNHTTNSENGRPMLTSITEELSGQSKVTSFSYQTNQKTWTLNPSWALLDPLVNAHMAIIDNNPPFFESLPLNAELFDVNGDALPDFIQNGAVDLVRFNTGSGWGPALSNPDLPGSFYQPNYYYDKGYRVADVNGDLLSDVLTSESPYNTMLSTGTDFLFGQPNFLLPESFVKSLVNKTEDSGLRVLDVNGDGLPDLIKATTFGQNPPQGYLPSAAYINDGTQFVQDNTWIPPIPTLGYNNGCSTCVFDYSTRFADINNDGLVDIIMAKPKNLLNQNGSNYWSNVQESIIYLNNGKGWSKHGHVQPGAGAIHLFPLSFTVIPYCSATECNYRDNALRFVDMNADGLVDLVRSATTPTLQGNTNLQAKSWRNNPALGIGKAQWIEDAALISDIPLVDNEFKGDMGGRLIDINADGVTDMLNGGFKTKITKLGDSTVSDLLSTVTLPEGGSIEIKYKASTQYRDAQNNLLNPKLPLIVQTVESITEKEPFANLQAETKYLYEGGHYHYAGPFDRKFAGFEKVTTLRPDQSKVISYFHQGNATNAALNEPADHVSKMGHLYRQETYDSQNKLYLRQTSLVDYAALPSTANNRFFVYPTAEITENFDGNQTKVATAKSFVYNLSTGNLTSETEYGDVSVPAPNQFTDQGDDLRKTSYVYATNGFGQYKPYSREIFGGPGNTLIGSEVFLYDNLPAFQLDKGLLTGHFRAIDSQNIQAEYFTYDATGFLLTHKDTFNQITTYTPDSYKLYPVSITNPLNQTTLLDYHYSIGAIYTLTDPNNHKTSYAYDGLGRLLTTNFHTANGMWYQLESRTYDDTIDIAAKKPASLTAKKFFKSGDFKETRTLLDGFGRTVRTFENNDDATGCVLVDKAYDPLGNLAKSALPYHGDCTAALTFTGLGGSQNTHTTFNYDVLGRMLSQSNILGTATWQYDDRVTTVIDPLGKQKKLAADAFGRLTKVTEYLGNTGYDTTYSYNHLDQLVKITDAAGNLRTFSYDLLGNRLSATDLHAPSDTLFGTVTETYDKGLRRLTTTKADGNVFNYSYDNLGRLLTKKFKNNVVETYSYDSCVNGTGRLCAVTAAQTTETFAYDPLGRLTTETLVTNQQTFTSSYGYDTMGNLTSQTHPNGEMTTFTYTRRGLPKTIRHQNISIIQNTAYNALGATTSILYANGKSTDTIYDPAKLFQLKKIETPFLHSTTYSFDALGNLLTETETSTNNPYTASYSYDDLSRLTAAALTVNGQTTNRNYSYDILGNILSGPAGNYQYQGSTSQNAWYGYATPHAATKFGATDVAYYRDGNVYAIGPLAHTYDHNSKLIKVQHAGTGQILGTYTYTPSGRRVAKFSTAGASPLPGGVLYTPTRAYDLDGTGTVTIRFFLGSRQVATLEKPASGTPMYRYHHHDHLGGTRLITDQSGNKVQTLLYHPFGEIRLNDQPTPYNEKRKYTGHLHDDETNLEYMEARYYTSEWNRFLSLDPYYQDLGANPDLSKLLLDPQSLNAYAYARNNPLKYVDPDGRLFLFALIPAQQFFQYAIIAAAGMAAVSAARVIQQSVVYSDPLPRIFADPLPPQKKSAPTTLPASTEKPLNITVDYGDKCQACSNVTVFPGSQQTGPRTMMSVNDDSLHNTAEKIGRGHAWDKHKDGFIKQGIDNQEKFIDHIESVIANPDNSKSLSEGRTSYIKLGSDGKSGTVVITNPQSNDRGTAVYSRNAINYFNNTK